jgi:hypothetical protein
MVRPGGPITLFAMETRPLCARPGCQGSTAAWLTYDYAGQQVWLDDAPSEAGGDQWALCSGHAGRLRAPQGWTQVDRRVGKPQTALAS